MINTNPFDYFRQTFFYAKHKPLLSAFCILLAACSVTLLSSCNKDQDTDTTDTDQYPCVVTSCPSYFGTTQTFEYNDKKQMTARSYDFNYPGYSTFEQTVSAVKTVYGYTYQGASLEESYIFRGGTGNLYDGLPAVATQVTRQKNADGTENSYSLDSFYLFFYDAKKRLEVVNHPSGFKSDNVTDYYTRHLRNTYLRITYDDNDNATELKQWWVYQYGTYNVNLPSENAMLFDSLLNFDIKITYDDKPSPFAASLKYWKFVQNDWGLAINSNWQAIITALSPHNPLTITYSMKQGNATSEHYSMTYNYNDHGLPADSYTYDCSN
ncbi:hypothetical protein [Parafilimonas sp.]|uniref:hypothetical protein n=1 Tax=Parafilimonas sp. TaxID=1969739 RepID=UPI0039E3F8AE